MRSGLRQDTLFLPTVTVDNRLSDKTSLRRCKSPRFRITDYSPRTVVKYFIYLLLDDLRRCWTGRRHCFAATQRDDAVYLVSLTTQPRINVTLYDVFSRVRPEPPVLFNCVRLIVVSVLVKQNVLRWKQKLDGCASKRSKETRVFEMFKYQCRIVRCNTLYRLLFFNTTSSYLPPFFVEA